MVLRVEDLEVYKLAEELADRVWHTCIQWDYYSKDTIGKQLVRSADSISANLAEGHGRYHFNDRLNFCYFAGVRWKKRSLGFQKPDVED